MSQPNLHRVLAGLAWVWMVCRLKWEVPLSAHIKEQINKDVWLSRNHPGFSPRWEFIGAGPSQEPREYLIKAKVLFVEYH